MSEHLKIRRPGNVGQPSGFDRGHTLLRTGERSLPGRQLLRAAPLTLPLLERTPACSLSPRRCPFGGACHTCPLGVQAKLTVSRPGDPYEQEADHVADQVLRMPEPQVQRACPNCDEEETVQTKRLAPTITPLVQRQEAEPEEEEEETAQRQAKQPEDDEEEETAQAKAAGHAPSVTPDIHAQIDALRGGGQPLPSSARAFFEPRFGRAFSGVRIHTDAHAAATARALNARAFTLGRDVVFGAGEYAPGTGEGRRLLAHELTHVVQQSNTSCTSGQFGAQRLVQRWFTEDNKAAERRYFFRGNDKTIAEKGTNHEDIVRSARTEVDQISAIYSQKAQEREKAEKRLVDSAAEPDRWKGGKIARFAEEVPELKQLGSTEVSKEQPKSGIEKQLHAEVLQDKLIKLNISAKNISKEGDIWRSLRVLGIYLHAKQDYFAHKVDLIEGGKDLRTPRESRTYDELIKVKQNEEQRGNKFTLTGPTYVLEDDPKRGKERWANAKNETRKILQDFLKNTRNEDRDITRLQKGMRPYIVRVENFRVAPFRETIKSIAEDAFKKLKILKLDWTGKTKRGEASIKIDTSGKGNIYGMLDLVFLGAIRNAKICKSKDMCEKTFKETPKIMGRIVANVFCHELGHQLGLDDVSIRGNYMWTGQLDVLHFKKKRTFEDRVLLNRTLEIAVSSFSDSQIIRMINKIKEQRKKHPPGEVIF